MIKLFLVFSLLFLCSKNLLLAQSEDSNLVVNPSFENFHFNKTPNNKFNPYRFDLDKLSSKSDTLGWYNPGGRFSSAGWYHIGNKKEKKRFIELHSLLPENGKSMIGMAFNLKPSGENYRDYLEGHLKVALLVGQTYQISFYLSPRDGCAEGVSEIGIYFLTSKNVFDNHFNNDFSIVPDIIIPIKHITEKGQLYHVDIPYIAKGKEQYFILGNFKNDKETQSVEFGKNTSNKFYSNVASMSEYLLDVFSIHRAIDIEGKTLKIPSGK